jgi:hypothetical protein
LLLSVQTRIAGDADMAVWMTPIDRSEDSAGLALGR